MSRFINPFTDVGFKRIFGQEVSKPLLLDFLNHLLEGERVIVDLTFLDKELPGVYDGDRSTIYDIYCQTDTGEYIIVEMQNRYQHTFKQRSVYYAAQAIARQGERGSQWGYDVKAVYVVSFLNFSLKEISADFRTDVGLMDMHRHTLFSDSLRLIFLQLPLFKKEADECDNDFERWIYVLKNMETLNRLPFAAQSAVFQKLASITDVASLSKDDRMKYDESLRKFRDTLVVMQTERMEGRAMGFAEGHEQGLAVGRAEGLAKGLEEGRAEGLEEGRAEGLEEGRAEAIHNNARKMKALGMAPEVIAQVTGLTADEIEQL